MIFWLLATALAVVILGTLSLPLLRRSKGPIGDPRSAAQADMAVYNDQLREVERDIHRGVLDPTEAETVRIEVSRRLLRAAQSARREAKDTDITQPPRWVRLAVMAGILLIPLLALSSYLPTGRWDLPAQPWLERQTNAGQLPASVQEALTALEAHLANTPDDVGGWTLASDVYMRMGRFADAVHALEQAVRIEPEVAEFYAALGEAITSVDSGTVGDKALAAFAAALARNSREPRALFYTGLARAQAGDAAGALRIWGDLVAQAPSDAPWLGDVVRRVRQVAADAGIDAAPILAAMPQNTTPTPEKSPRSGTARADADKSNPAEPSQPDIRAMVDRLAARLASSPDDVEGWLRLANARRVLGEPDKAVAALEQARLLAPEDADIEAAYGEALMAAAGVRLPAGGVLAPGSLPPMARRAFEQALTRDPDNPVALWWLSLDAAGEGHSADALRLLRRLLAALPNPDPLRAHVEAILEQLTRTK